MTKNLLNVRPMLLLMIAGIGMAMVACASKPSSSSSSRTNTTSSAPRTVTTASTATGFEADILALINKHRRARGLAALQTHPAMTEEARRHSMAMATNRVAFGHAGFNIRSKIVQSKIPGTNAVAENVAYGSNSAKEVVDGWLNSSGHKKNIEGKYKYTGIGVARDKSGRLFFTQIFAR